MKLHESDVMPQGAGTLPDHPEVWVFAPHPDDEVYGCGGAMTLHLRAGHRVHVVVLTDGAEQGVGKARVQQREAESRTAAVTLGLEDIQFWALPDRGLEFDEALVGRVQQTLANAGPCTVYAPSLWEAHPDHRACALAVAEALRRRHAACTLMYYEISAPLRANCLIDITPVWAIKQQAMGAFTSQEAVLAYSEYVAGLNRYRSMTATPKGYAEAFEQVSLETLLLGNYALLSPAAVLHRRAVPAVPADQPLVSVLVRTTGRSTLSRAVQSVFQQTYAHVEVVLVDAAGEGAAPGDWPAYAPVRWVSHGKPLGRSEAANAALDAAQGDWLIFLDDDDWLYPDHLAKLVQGTWSAEEKLVYTGVLCLDEKGQPTGNAFEVPYVPRELCFGNFIPIHAALFSRKLVEQGCRFDTALDIYEDWDFWLQAEAKTSFRFVPGISAAYQITGGSGMGVHLERTRAAAATQAVYRKWKMELAPGVFDELVMRALDRRRLQLSVAQARAAVQDLHHHLGSANEKIGHLQLELQSQLEAQRQRMQADINAAEDAKNVALGTAHHLRIAHDDACLQRDRAIRTKRQLDAEIQQILTSRSWKAAQIIRKVGSYRVRLADVLRRRGMGGTLRHAVAVVRHQGLKVALRKGRNLLRPPPPSRRYIAGDMTYEEWVVAFDEVHDAERNALAEEYADLLAQLKMDGREPIKFSIVMPVYNTRESDMRQAVASLQAQTYLHWELCMCDDASPQPHVVPLMEELAASEPRIKFVRSPDNVHIARATNQAIALATGDYVAFLDHDDTLAPHALLRVAQKLAQAPQVKLLYSDEDKLSPGGGRLNPYFKTDFNLGLLRSHNYMCHFAVMEAGLLRELGGIRTGYDGAQDYDLMLRAVDSITPDQIAHIPHVLYHWRMAPGSTANGAHEKSYAYEAGRRAITEHLERRGLQGEVMAAPEAPGMYRVRYIIPGDAPKVSIIIPTRNGEALLRQCLDSLRKTDYANYEVIVIDNGSDDAAALALMSQRQAEGQIRVLRDDSPFNFSALNNRAVRKMAQGEFVLLMNNDIEVTHPEWLAEMVGMAVEPGVGCVGARLWYPDGTLQHGGVIMVCGVAGHAHKCYPRGNPGYFGRAVIAQDFLAVTAACLLVRKSIYEEVNGLDETLKVAFNDVDFCLRVHSAGYRNVWTPHAELIHYESVTRGYEDTPEKIRRFEGEVEKLQARWSHFIANDPYLNPNLSADSEHFQLAWPPRRPMP